MWRTVKLCNKCKYGKRVKSEKYGNGNVFEIVCTFKEKTGLDNLPCEEDEKDG